MRSDPGQHLGFQESRAATPSRDTARSVPPRFPAHRPLWLVLSVSLLFQSLGIARADIIEVGPAQAGYARKFIFTGNTAIPTAILQEVVRPFVGRVLSPIDLEGVRVALTLAYVTNGYVNSGAIIDRPPDGDGNVAVRIIEGRLTDIVIRNNHRMRSEFYEHRLAPLRLRPLNKSEISERLQLLRDTYSLKQIHGDLKPGAVPGEASLAVDVVEPPRARFGLNYANDRPPSSGSEQTGAEVHVTSLSGRNDPLDLSIGIGRGSTPGLSGGRMLGLNDCSANYSAPVTAADTTIGLQYGRGSSSIVEARFSDLNIASRSEVIGISLAQPLFRSSREELVIGLAGERKSSFTTLLGEPTSFTPGAVDGWTVVSAVRLFAQYSERDSSSVFAARLALNYGLDLLDATTQTNGPDGQFLSLLAQFRYARRWRDTDHDWVIRTWAQYSPNPLLSLEQAALGGANSVRGYRENTLVRDNAVFASAEFRWVIAHRSGRAPLARIVPFVSVGSGWNNDQGGEFADQICSAGLGIQFTPCNSFEASLFWGYGFQRFHYAEHDLQDDGIHFRMVAWKF